MPSSIDAPLLLLNQPNMNRETSLNCTGTDEHQKVWELLSKAWSAIESNLEGFAIQIFRLMFKRDPGLFPLFPFYKDEWSRVAYTDYNGTYPEQPPNAWFVVFR